MKSVVTSIAAPSRPASHGEDNFNDITVEGVGLTFPNGFVGLKSTDLHIPGGTFCTLLGPSGSGKTTLLRAIAGLSAPTSGRIRIGDRDVTSLPVQARNVGFVFQNYALFPHMNVAENIGYPLRLHKWSEGDRAARVKEILELIELPHLAGRGVGELSGGQQQRVAIGRALSYRPSLLLLDEPMGALDRRLRQQLGTDLRDVQQRTGITAVYVTHDQEEAFILSDKVAIMSHGEILQYAAPDELYYRPRSKFVAQFLGEANLIQVTDIRQSADGSLEIDSALGPFLVHQPVPSPGVGGNVTAIVRPEDIRFRLDDIGAPDEIMPFKVEIVRDLFLGSRCLVTVRAPDGTHLRVECAKPELPKPGADVWITWKATAVVLVDR
ncbi:branched-chain amino acid ABC transporter substrate-binding protein (plasmid) [Aureimonas sp. SA4125]|uniref:ABC transporter ATP-binding protein n=1 Tax=Aureimonas sp. SA4125 TaxID=2826993 RepID=UPI001CC546AB|nr:ABC transporter ATP-binding protein [Aureimonas sp. SA4125]BDA87176.1 branched-chain amino acid ABC transporter substrate-binding protein [Aureimonas sp. SA4125]